MNVTSVGDIDFNGENVIVRCDLDVVLDKKNENNPRLDASVKTVKKVIEKGARKVAIIGHIGRPYFAKATKDKPKGRFDEKLSTHKLIKYFEQKLSQRIYFVGFNDLDSFDLNSDSTPGFQLYLLDNLRFWKGEKENSEDFAKLLKDKFAATAYINEAFAVSHREHVSVIVLPKLIEKKCVGIRFKEEIDNLSKVLDAPKRPVVTILGGFKEDKLKYVDPLKNMSNKVLVTGRLPEYLGDMDLIPETLEVKGDTKLVVARLNPDKEDITLGSVEIFEEIIRGAGTIIMAGPAGKFEDEGQQLGTTRILAAIEKSGAYKVAGGGESEKVIGMLGDRGAFDWISTGGGAMLDFLANGDLPGIEALG